jgi:flagellar motor switch protein FliN/FliY
MSDLNEQVEAQPVVDAPEQAEQEKANPSASQKEGAALTEGYSPPRFGELDEDDVSGNINLDLILDVPVTLSMEVGHARVPIRTLLQLNQGSVVELDRTAGEPLDVYVNGTLIAHGEVVVVNDKFGVRLLDVVSPAERIRKLK